MIEYPVSEYSDTYTFDFPIEYQTRYLTMIDYNRRYDSRFPNADLEDSTLNLASELVGNWRKFDSFGWHTQYELDDPRQFCIVYTANRDSDLLTESNAKVIDDTLRPYVDLADELPTDNIRSESHSHWACGWVEGYAIRVYAPNGTITPEFIAYANLYERMERYPVLDEDDYYQRESDSEYEYLESLAHDLNREYDTDTYTADMLYSAIREYDINFGYAYYGETYIRDNDLTRLAYLSISLQSRLLDTLLTYPNENDYIPE